MIFPRCPLVFVATTPVDLRSGLDKLAAIVSSGFGLSVRDGAFFVFLNRTRNKLRILHFDKTGAWLLSKRLDRGTFPLPVSLDARCSHVLVSPEELKLLLDGLTNATVLPKKTPPPLHLCSSCTLSFPPLLPLRALCSHR